MTDEERVELITQIANNFGISCDDASYIIKSFENFGKEQVMLNIEDDLKKLNKFNEYENTVVLSEEALYEIQDAIEHILSEREQDKARIKELEEENRIFKNKNVLVNRYFKLKDNSIPKQKVKEILDKAEVMDYYTLPDVINDLQELLEEGE